MSPRTAYFLGALIGLLLGIIMALRFLSKVGYFCAHWPTPRGLTFTLPCDGTFSPLLAPLPGPHFAFASHADELPGSPPHEKASVQPIKGG